MCLENELKWLEEQKYNNEIISTFAIYWCIYEREILQSRMGITPQPQDLIDNIYNIPSVLSRVDSSFNHFWSRYFNQTERIEALFNQNINSINNNFKNAMNKLKTDMSDNQARLTFLFFILNRFRNNIFHGNKTPSDWERNKPEISHCIKLLYTFIQNKKN